jgi:signal transduction histidine kinase
MFQARKPNSSETADSEPDEKVIQARDELLDGLAHDLKNAISSIVMNTSLARRMLPGKHPEKQAEKEQLVLQMIDRIQEATDRISEVMQDTMDMTKCVSGSLKISPARRDVKVLVGDALSRIESSRAAKNIKIELQIAQSEKDGLTVIADREKMPVALARLMTHGIKVSPASSTLELGVDESGHEVSFRLILPAATIPREQREKLFDRQGKKAGLYLVRGIVEAFGGHTWVNLLPDERIELGFSLKNANAIQSTQDKESDRLSA